MGESAALKSGSESGRDSSDSLADFGKNLFKKGKELAAGIEKKVAGIDLKEVTAQGQEHLKGMDLGSIGKAAGKEAGKLLKNVNQKDLQNIAGAAVGLGFPQLSLLEKGSAELGDLVARKQAKKLLDDPGRMADSFQAGFDEFDREKSGFLSDEKLRRLDGLGAFGSDSRASALILRSGFTSFNSLDGIQDKEGISRKDLQIFSMMQNKELLGSYARRVGSESGICWGTAGAAAGFAGTYLKHAGADFSLAALKSVPPGKLALVTVGTALVVGGAAKLISQYRQESHLETKQAELEQLFKSMKASF